MIWLCIVQLLIWDLIPIKYFSLEQYEQNMLSKGF